MNQGHLKPDETSTGCPADMPESEDDRVESFVKIHKQWPPTIAFPGGQPIKATPAWDAYMKNKEDKLMELTDHGWKWERWLEQVQIRNLKNFTATGWHVAKLNPELHSRVSAFFKNNYEEAMSNRDEGAVAGYITGKRSMLSLPGALKREVTEEIQRLVAEWVGFETEAIEPTSTYGVRIYHNQSTLATHVDRVETHILSTVYCIDREVEEPKIAACVSSRVVTVFARLSIAAPFIVMTRVLYQIIAQRVACPTPHPPPPTVRRARTARAVADARRPRPYGPQRAGRSPTHTSDPPQHTLTIPPPRTDGRNAQADLQPPARSIFF
jgi:hypothetical protein